MRKGVSLASLIIYIIGLSTILGIVAAFNINIMDTSNEFVAISKINEQYTIFNMYFLKTIKNATQMTATSNTVTIDGTKTYTYNSNDRTVLYSDGVNNNIVVCKYVDNLVFTNLSEGIVSVDITFKIKNTLYEPQNINFVVGRGYDAI